MDKKIILAGFLLLLFGTANAVTLTGDFSLETDCFSPDDAVYILSNESGSTQVYKIRAVGENSDWININGEWIGSEELTIMLLANQSKELYAFVKPQSCYVEPGNYSITIEVSNSETISREISVRVLESRVLELEITPESKGTAQCVKEEFEVKVRNTGGHKEKVVLSFEGLPVSWVSLHSTEFFLDEGESRTLGFEITPACNAQSKEYRFSIKASLQGTSFFVEEEAILEVEDRQEIKITWPPLKACVEKATTSEIMVRNEGLLEDTIVLSIEGIQWATIQPSELSLEPGEEMPVSIVFFKTNAEKDEYDFTIKAHSTKFGSDWEKSASVELQECYWLSIQAVKIDGQEPLEKPHACIEERPVYTFSLANEGLEPIEVDIRVLGLDAIISPSTISIESGEAKEVKVEFDLSPWKPGEKIFTIKASGENISMQKEYTLIAEECFDLEVNWNDLAKQVELDANCKSEPFTLAIKNTGTRSQNVSVAVHGPNWIYFEPPQAKIMPGKTQEVYFYFAPPYDTTEGTHNATISVKGEQVSQSQTVEMVVYGGLYAELGNASVEAEAEVENIIERRERSLGVLLHLSNNGDTVLRLNSIKAKDFNAEFDFEETTLQPLEEIEVPMTLYIGQSDENQFAVTLAIDTDKGVIERAVAIDLTKQPEEQSLQVGLIGLPVAELSDLVLAAVVIIIIAVFAVIAIKAESGQRPESGLKHLVEEVKGIPGKKLEEIGKHRKGSNKNLQDIVKQVKKKHVSKKPANKKAARKKKR